MCGIVGYVGRREAGPILVEGLRRLEYRGYDSAGVAILNGDGLRTIKRPGKIAELVSVLDRDYPVGTCGIAHTRWATHGAPNRVNAHPHLSAEQDIALVHNGIIENSRRVAAQSSHSSASGSRSDTDTEDGRPPGGPRVSARKAAKSLEEAVAAPPFWR